MTKIRAWIPQWLINYSRHLPLAFFSLVFFRFPARKLKIIGVTGTDGKTTTVTLIYKMLKEAGLSVGMVSTVSALIGDKEIDTGFHVTAPNPWHLQKLLRRMVDQGIKYAVLEVTSHGLDQFRVLGIDYWVGVITNVTHEHLDYHKTYENYLEAKARLLRSSKVAVLNRDDRSYEYLDTKIQRYKDAKIVTYGIKNKADFSTETFPFKTRLPGEYNQYNCLAAIAVGSILKIPPERIRKVISSFRGVTGRMEEIDEGQDFKTIVDFAHTPNALEQALKTLQGDLKDEGRLIAVFGAAGLRDREKRPMMGQVAGRLADLAVITAEDPRTEVVEEICRQIAQGCRSVNAQEVNATKQFSIRNQFATKEKMKSYFIIIIDRQQAIDFAIKAAKKGDIVVVCGKGHERSMCFGTTEYPWSDQEAVRKALKGRRPA